MPSTPVEYADNLVTGCIKERKLNFIMVIVYQQGCTWHYEFNARKSGVLIYGEDRLAYHHNTQLRDFGLRTVKVRELGNYGHLGIRASINKKDVSGVEERLSKL